MAVAVLCTCGTLDRFDVATSASAQIPKGTVLDQVLDVVQFDEFDDLDFSQEIANQGVREDQVDSVGLKAFVVHTEEGSNLTLDFITSIKFFAEAEGQPRILIAESDAFEGKTSVELEIDAEAELKPYVIAPSMTIDAVVEGKRPDQDTLVTADVTLNVDATVPGCE